MNIALLHYAAPPVVGGVESVISHHASLMADAGHKVMIIAGRGERIDRRISFLQMPLVDSMNHDVLAIKSDLDKGIINNRFDVLVKALEDELCMRLAGMDYLICHNVCSLNKNLALTAAIKRISERKGMPKIILWHHDLAWTTPRYRAELHPGYPWDLLRTDWEGVLQVVVSQARKRELATLMNIVPGKIMVIPNGIDARSLLKMEDKTSTLVDQLDLLHADPLLLLPVRITPRKNLELGIRMIAELRKIFPEAGAVVTGPIGPHNPANVSYFSMLHALRADLNQQHAFHFLADQVNEYLPDEVISDFYRLCDALFLPSREEGFGIPILEAGLAGMPVFCSDIAPLHDLGGDYATYFPPDIRPAEVAEMVYRRLKNDPVYNLRRRVKMEFTWERIYHEKIHPLFER